MTPNSPKPAATTKAKDSTARAARSVVPVNPFLKAWRFLCAETNARAGHPATRGVAEQYEKDWRWVKIEGVFPILYRGIDVEAEDDPLRTHVLVRLPDHLFRLVVEFAESKEVDQYF